MQQQIAKQVSVNNFFEKPNSQLWDDLLLIVVLSPFVCFVFRGTGLFPFSLRM